MIKTTVYLPSELEVRLDAEASATGTSKAELIRKAIAQLLDNSTRPRKARALPVFNSGRQRSAETMDEEIYEHIKQRAARR